MSERQKRVGKGGEGRVAERGKEGGGGWQQQYSNIAI